MNSKRIILIGGGILVVIIALVIILPGLIHSPAAMPVAAAVQSTADTIAPSPTIAVTGTASAVPTASVIPSSPTPANTNTPIPTPTPEKLAVAEGGFTAWCMPKDIVYSKEELAKTGAMPEGARVGTYNADGIMELLVQVESCTFEYTFNQPAPSNLTLQVYDLNPQPFIKKPMVVSADNPAITLTSLTHDYIIDPPFWDITYRIEVVDESGTVLSSQNIKFKRSWFAGYCWQGEIPDPVTLKCPFHGEAHPWDPWFGWDYPKGINGNN